MSKYKVQILMSTYNGERFIRKQLDSIVMQSYPVQLLIRDDGSTDSTLDIIKEYEKKYNNISHVEGKNVGVIHSFFKLFRMADKEADMYAMADQDDIWFEKKIEAAVKRLSRMNLKKPCMYCSAQTLIDADDNVLISSMREVKMKPGFGNSIVENIATGCTCVINKKLLEAALAEPDYTVMHDWWLYMLSTSMGEFYYDPKPRMYYRQHGNNTMGTRTNYIDEFKERFKRFSGNKNKLYRQMCSFEKLHGDKLTGEDKEILEMMIGYKKDMKCRIRCIFSNKIYRQRFTDNMIFKLLFLMNHI